MAFLGAIELLVGDSPLLGKSPYIVGSLPLLVVFALVTWEFSLYTGIFPWYREIPYTSGKSPYCGGIYLH